MTRRYAGILGYLGMAIMLARGAINGGGIEGTLTQAIAALLIMALIGAVVGAIAQTTIDESVRSSLESQLAAAGELETQDTTSSV